MTIKVRQFRSIKPLLQYLKKLAIEESSDKWVFRGHTSDRYLLKTWYNKIPSRNASFSYAWTRKMPRRI